VAAELDEVVHRVSRSDPDHTVDELTAAAVRLLRPAGWASVSLLDKGHFRTLAPTGDLAVRADRLQYEVGSGPCVDAALEDSVFVTEDLSRDERWPEFGARAVGELGVHGMLSYRLSLPEKLGAVAALNVYSLAREGFEDDTIWRGLLLASQASLALSAQLALEEADNLRVALGSNREIGVAIGILMNRHLLTREEAFDALRTASQDQNRKLVHIAAEVVDSGDLTSARGPVGPFGTNGNGAGSPESRSASSP
jgi:hypothetical protein